MLTKKQKQILDFIQKYIKKNDYSPTLEEMSRHFKLASVATVHQHVSALKEKGYLNKIENQRRSINVFGKEDLISVPLLGTIAAGGQIEMFQQSGENIAISKTKIRPNQNYFTLKVSGNSMIEKNIKDGDIVLVRQQGIAENGEKIVALIDNSETTLKTFFKEKGQIRLQPANEDYEAIIIKNGEREFSIQGIVIDVIQKQTGYSVYNNNAKAKLKQNPLTSLYPKLPNKKFDIIYADPPWDYNGKLQFDKSSKSAEQIDLSKNIFISSASFKYPTLKTSELMKIPIHKITKSDCLLFMWTTNPHLTQAVDLGRAWGFEYRTVAFVWDKMVHNPGQYTLSNCELCLVFKRGRIPRPRGVRNIQQLIRSPRKEHSEKPVEVIQAIEKMFPTQKRIELFARKKTGGWTTWGLDIIEEN